MIFSAECKQGLDFLAMKDDENSKRFEKVKHFRKKQKASTAFLTVLAFCQFDLYTFIYIYEKTRGQRTVVTLLQRIYSSVPQTAMKMSQGTNDAPFARSATSFGTADIIGRGPTSFAAKPQLRSFVPRATMQMSQDSNDVACATQTMLCLAAQMKNPKDLLSDFWQG